MKHLATLVIVSVALTVSASGQAPRGRALAIEDYYRIKSVGDPQISPNGRWVAYTVSTRVEEDNTNAIDTYVVRRRRIGRAAADHARRAQRGVAAMDR